MRRKTSPCNCSSWLRRRCRGDYKSRLRAGGLGYGELKKALFEHYWNYFAAPRAKRAELRRTCLSSGGLA